MSSTVIAFGAAFATVLVPGTARPDDPPSTAQPAHPSSVRVYDFEDTSCCGVAPREKWDATQTNPSEKPAQWNTYASSSAASGHMALSARGPDSGGSNTFSILIARDTSYRDLELSVKIQPFEGKEDQGGGLIWRVKDANNYYVARWNPLENNLRVYTVKDGVRGQLASQDIKVEKAGWHTLAVSDVGSKISARLDEGEWLEVQDATFADTGSVGLWLKADAATWFDDLRIADKSEKKE